MRNKYPGTCYRCGERVEAGEGHFERYQGVWLTQHDLCAVKYRGVPKLPYHLPRATDKKPYKGGRTMNQRKDKGDILHAEFVPPQPTGNRAVVHMTIDVLVEVQETDSWNDMVEQAKEELRKRIKEGKGFLPFRTKADMIHDNTTVDYIQQRITIDPKRSW